MAAGAGTGAAGTGAAGTAGVTGAVVGATDPESELDVKRRRKPLRIVSKKPPPLRAARLRVFLVGILLYYNKIPTLLIVWTPVN